MLTKCIYFIISSLHQIRSIQVSCIKQISGSGLAEEKYQHYCLTSFPHKTRQPTSGQSHNTSHRASLTWLWYRCFSQRAAASLWTKSRHFHPASTSRRVDFGTSDEVRRDVKATTEPTGDRSPTITLQSDVVLTSLLWCNMKNIMCMWRFLLAADFDV